MGNELLQLLVCVDGRVVLTCAGDGICEVLPETGGHWAGCLKPLQDFVCEGVRFSENTWRVVGHS